MGRIALAVVLVAVAASCGDFIIAEPTVERVEITAPSRTLAVGDSLVLRAVAYGAHDRPFPPLKVPVGWRSDAPAVAVADPSTGVVRGIAPGRATIRAMARSRQDTVTVTVVAAPTP